MQALHFAKYARKLLALLALVALLAAPGATSAQPPRPAAWRDTGITTSGGRMCFDVTRPGVVLFGEPDGTVAYTWATGERTVLNPRAFDRCGPGGLVFDVPDVEGGAFDGPTWRFRPADQTATSIAHAPTHIAVDGSLQVYALYNGRLWASPDGGLTWSQRDQQLPGRLISLALSNPDARAIYALAVQGTSGAAPDQVSTAYTIFFSPDAGLTWEPRFNGQFAGPADAVEYSVEIGPLPGNTAPVDTLQLGVRNGISPSTPTHALISTDGARTFREVGSGTGYNPLILAHTGDGILRLIGGTYGSRGQVSFSRDGGLTWEDLPAPPHTEGVPSGSCFYPPLPVVEHAPANLLFCDNGAAWYSPDRGLSWQALGSGITQIGATPYEPLTLLSLRQDGRLQVLDLPDAGRSLTAAVGASGAPGGLFFPATGHNLSAAFLRYWTAHGGLAQFGYPRSEPFPELNPADGRAYLAQYFERARFEYHPELAGTDYEVLLGLLGSQLTAARRAGDEAPFQPVDDPRSSGASYFPQTGHTLRGAFQYYWQQHGGLAIYGYPISEEFEEVNRANNQVYLTQYFERARFEYHPELAGSGYEVLLGLLGNELLRERGWQ